MSKNPIQPIIDGMDPEEALQAITPALKKLFPLLGEEALLNFVVDLVGDAGRDKVGSMVHLWLATCMGEGVDPTQMCRSLVDKVARSQQLLALADPEILLLFEEWLEALEEEMISQVKETGLRDPGALARRLGVSLSGATFLLNKLTREGRL